MKGKGMKYFIAVLLIAVLAFGLFACKSSNQDPEPGPIIDNPPVDDGKRCDLNLFRYKETGPDGEYSVFMEQTYGQARYVIHDVNGEDRQYYVDNQVLFDLYDYMQEHDFENWRYLDSEDVEKETDTTIKIEYRINGMKRDFGSVRMPKGGIELLQGFKEIAKGYESDDKETKPFKVKIGGKEYWTKRGTGNSVGTGAVIDFGDDIWWIVEKFVGHYEITDYSRKLGERKNPDHVGGNWEKATLDIYEDGRLVLQVGDDIRETTLDEDRLWDCYATAMGGEMYFDFCYDDEKDKYVDVLVFMMRGLPYPETFQGYELYLEKTGKH